MMSLHNKNNIENLNYNNNHDNSEIEENTEDDLSEASFLKSKNLFLNNKETRRSNIFVNKLKNNSSSEKYQKIFISSILWKIYNNRLFILSLLYLIVVYYIVINIVYYQIYEGYLYSNYANNSSNSNTSNNMDNIKHKRNVFGIEDSFSYLEYNMFHIALFLSIINVFQVSLYSPGTLANEYNEIYSLKNYYEKYNSYYKSMINNLRNNLDPAPAIFPIDLKSTNKLKEKLYYDRKFNSNSYNNPLNEEIVFSEFESNTNNNNLADNAKISNQVENGNIPEKNINEDNKVDLIVDNIGDNNYNTNSYEEEESIIVNDPTIFDNNEIKSSEININLDLNTEISANNNKNNNNNLTNNPPKVTFNNKLKNLESMINKMRLSKNYRFYWKLKCDNFLTSSIKENTCLFCGIIKPERVVHCRYCRKCHMKMDHHCFFINNCIGLYNYKLFLNLLMNVLILSIFSLIIIVRVEFFKMNLVFNSSGVESIDYKRNSIDRNLNYNRYNTHFIKDNDKTNFKFSGIYDLQDNSNDDEYYKYNKDFKDISFVTSNEQKEKVRFNKKDGNKTNSITQSPLPSHSDTSIRIKIISNDVYFNYIVYFITISLVIIVILLIYYLTFHLILVFKGLSQIEHMFRLYNVNNIYYDKLNDKKSNYTKWCEVFGNNFLVWFVPVNVKPMNNGYVYY